MLENIRLKGMIEYQKGLYDLEVKYFKNDKNMKWATYHSYVKFNR